MGETKNSYTATASIALPSSSVSLCSETSLLILNQEEQDTYNDCWTDINNKVTEMTAAFITGQADLEKDWDTYINDLYDMGLQEVIDVYQAALDRYNGK